MDTNVLPREGGDRSAIAPRQRLPAGVLEAYPAPSANGSSLTLAGLWHVIWEWRWLVLSTLVLGTALAIIATLLMTPLYQATAQLEINPPTVSAINDTTAAGSTAEDRDFMGTQIGLIQGRALAERVVQDLNLAAQSEEGVAQQSRAQRQKALASQLNNNVAVTMLPASRLLNIQFTSPNPGLAARVANAYADGYITSTLERKYQASSYARDFLQRQIAKTRKDLEDSERKVVAYAQSQGIISMGEGSGNDANTLPGASLSSLNSALSSATAARIEAETALRAAGGASTTSEISERTAGLRTQRAALQAQYQQKLNTLRPDYPEMVALKSQIDSLTQAIGQEAGSVRSGRQATLQQAFRAARAAENQLRGQVNALRGQVLNLRGRSIQYTILQREVDTNRAQYDALLQRYKEVGIAGGIGETNASIVERALPPSRPYSPNLLFNLFIGSVVGLLTGIGLALLLEFINDTIKTPDDVRYKLQLPFLGGVPESKGKTPIEDLQDGTSPISEAYLSIASSIRISGDGEVPRSLMVTSTRPAEGKSTTIWAIAQTFARLDKSVLLIDADLRKPAFVTDAEKTRGLSFMLGSDDSLANHVLRTEVDGLWVMPGGVIPSNPAELLASSRFKSILAEAMDNFDIVMVDSAPILGLADAPILAEICEAVIIVVEAGKTRTRAAIEAIGRLQNGTATILGAALTKYRQPSGYGYRYNYEQYGYKQVENSDRKIRLAVTSDDTAK